MRGEKVNSMGQIQRWRPYVGPALVWDRQDPERGGWELYGGIYRDLLLPTFGGLGVAGEGYFRHLSGDNDGGLRLFGVTPFFGLQFGVDYSFISEDADFVMSFSFPWRRSGPLGKGDLFRIDWYHSRDNSFSFGLTIPIFQPWMGKTRPQRDAVELPRKPKPEKPVFEPSVEMQKSLDAIRDASFTINSFTIPFIDQDAETDEAHMDVFLEALNEGKAYIASTDELFPDGHTWAAEVSVYHSQLQKAFTMAADSGEEKGEEVILFLNKFH